jgi:dynein heavy chain
MFGLHPNADMISFKNEQNNIFRNASILLGRSLIDQETSKRASGSKSENNSQNETDTSQDDEDSEDSEDDREENDDVNDGSKDSQTRNLTSGHLLSPGMDFLSHGDLELLKATVARMGARLPKLLDVSTDDATTQSLLTKPDQAPYVSFILQESFRMNLLIREMRCTLGQLRLALMGKCSMSNKLGAVAADILINEIPASFRKWASTKTLGHWYDEFLARHWELSNWSSNMQMPPSIWLTGLFNPAALLVAMVQVASHHLQVPMNELTVETHFTRINKSQEVKELGVDVRGNQGGGVLFHGLSLAGCRWTETKEVGSWYTVEKAPLAMQCGGSLRQSVPKKLQSPLPLIFARAVKVQPNWTPAGITYLRNDPHVFDCPVYLTHDRGNTYSFNINIPLDEEAGDAQTWIKAGAAAILESL